jgi:hypothetical protein
MRRNDLGVVSLDAQARSSVTCDPSPDLAVLNPTLRNKREGWGTRSLLPQELESMRENEARRTDV